MAQDKLECEDQESFVIACHCGEVYGLVLDYADEPPFYTPIPAGFVVLPERTDGQLGWELIGCPNCGSLVKEGKHDGVISVQVTSSSAKTH